MTWKTPAKGLQILCPLSHHPQMRRQLRPCLIGLWDVPKIRPSPQLLTPRYSGTDNTPAFHAFDIFNLPKMTKLRSQLPLPMRRSDEIMFALSDSEADDVWVLDPFLLSTSISKGACGLPTRRAGREHGHGEDSPIGLERHETGTKHGVWDRGPWPIAP
ncbi:hypothetical protein AFLA_007619 [Aspergillus flavus NRRL3357]|nr:hypothetical protein AFLA_007619 [Aspergillus flavus NRRL3357]